MSCSTVAGRTRNNSDCGLPIGYNNAFSLDLKSIQFNHINHTKWIDTLPMRSDAQLLILQHCLRGVRLLALFSFATGVSHCSQEYSISNSNIPIPTGIFHPQQEYSITQNNIPFPTGMFHSQQEHTTPNWNIPFPTEIINCQPE